MIKFLFGFLLGLLIEFIGANIFLRFVTSWFRPKLSIGNQYLVDKDQDGKERYYFCCSNVGKRDAIDVKFDLILYTPDDGDVFTETLKLKKASHLYLPHKENKDMDVKTYGLNDIMVSCEKDYLDNLWTDRKSFVKLVVSAEDPVSGYKKTFYKKFHKKNLQI